MLLNHQQRKILELLCKTEHVTASELAGQLGIGVKTVRVRIKELNPELEKKGIQILSKSRYGYYLDPRQPEGIEGLLNPKENEDPVIPSNNRGASTFSPCISSEQNGIYQVRGVV